MLVYIGGGIVETLVADEAERPFLAQLRSGWVSDLNGEEPPEALRLLGERLKSRQLHFRDTRSKTRARQLRLAGRGQAEKSTGPSAHRHRSDLHQLPVPDAASVDSDQRFSQDQLPQFWEFVQGIEDLAPKLANDGDPLHQLEDLLCGAIAVLIVKHHDWLWPAGTNGLVSRQIGIRGPPSACTASIQFRNRRRRPKMGFLRRRGRRRASCT